MDYIMEPQAIEQRSMEIIAAYLTDLNLNDQAARVYSRIIHAAGDPDYAKSISIHPQAIAAGMQALQQGRPIYCDVEMVRTGINKRRLAEYGGEAHCLIADSGIAEQARQAGITRAMAAIRAFADKLDGAILAVGNAPTALFEAIKIMQESQVRPAVIISVPVGFVGAAESKEYLAAHSPVPYITVHGNKGGSAIAASAINALLYMLPGK
ncbi:MAG TPA: precorrin-8X methylmutase [Methylomusa anaerophila]|uniref:Precorrin-8X methylmutase n=1 Tax=Methylomusa anaerophila TaxID=1930071 RepID=A0A348AL74_9FIRM|nr:precorrin-8X methylmutase [Methylomusa anaerophila]BBB91822.1 precorrin-8X methylmutase [Methylomusa anaerophila]HML88445.1 precorrin-8X methylmutase [Methylomusa anaerophila]